MNNTLTMLAATAFIAPTALGQIVTDPAANYAVGTEPSGVAALDLDNDGDLDLATTVDDPDRLQFLINDGSGQYTLGPSAFLGASSSPQDVIAADFNGDGLDDLAVALRDPSGTVSIFMNTGAGTVSLMTSASVGERPRGLSAGDIDGDGDLDLAVANRDANSAHVLRNDGGSFSSQVLITGAEPRKTILADFDGDSDLDLAVTNHDSRTVGVYTNSGGTFALTSTLFVNGINALRAGDAGDVDNDGDADLVVAVSDNVLNGVQIFSNQGASFVSSAVFSSGGQNSSHVVLVDLDCDGILDAAVSNNDSASVAILPGLGGSFGPPALTAVGISPDELTVGDFDGDGDMDVASANRDSNSLSVIRNQSDCGTPANTDVNGDGSVDFADLVSVLAAWGACGGCAEDIDGDQMVGFSDLTLVIASWS